MATKDSKKDSSPATSRRRRIFDIIQIGQVNDLPSRAFDFFIILMILLNIAVLFMRTFESLNSYETIFVAL